MKKIIFLTSLILLSAGCTPANSELNNSCSGIYNTKILVSSTGLCIQRVSSEKDLEKGLSDRASMQSSQGMLFDFTRGPSTSSGQNAAMPAFWMKDMKFDLDLIWIKNNKIIYITKNVPAPRNADENQNYKLPNYSPPSVIDHVLEVNAGWTDKNKIIVGDEIKF